MELRRSYASMRRQFAKFKLPCQTSVNAEHPTTEPWLTIETLLHYTDRADIAILKGTIGETKQIVVKFGAQLPLEEEYAITERLYDARIPNFVKYLCYFSCKDTFADLFHQNYRSRPYICNGRDANPINNIGCTVMPYYPIGSMKDYAWTEAELPALKNLAKQCCFSMLDAYVSLGFIHRDIHLGNVLLRKTKKRAIQYKHAELRVEGGMYAIWMDLERHMIVQDADPANAESGLKELYNALLITINMMCRSSNSDIVLEFNQRRLLDRKSAGRPITPAFYAELGEDLDAIKLEYVRSKLPKIDFRMPMR